MRRQKTTHAWMMLGFALMLGWPAPRVRAGEPEATRFLFIGNSFTGRHTLKDIFLALAREGNPGQSFAAEQLTYGGRDLFRHYELFRSQNLLRLGSLSDDELRRAIGELGALAESKTEPPFYVEYWTRMYPEARWSWQDAAGTNTEPRTPERNLKPSPWEEDRDLIKRAMAHHEKWMANRLDYPRWDYVVLQSWHDLRPEPDVGYAEYAAKFAADARRQGTKPVLYITAPTIQNSKPVDSAVRKEGALTETRIAAELAAKIGAVAAPIPLAIVRIQEPGTTLTFRYVNDGHPNQLCAYLTACMLYAAVFGKSPEGLALREVVETRVVAQAKPDCDPDGGPRRRVFTDAERLGLQRAAWQATEAFRKGEY